MYAVVTTGGKQYRVEPGSTLIVERLAADAGASITFDRVLLVGDGEAVTVGTPTVEGASVSGTVLGEELGPKLIIFKFKQKVKYRRTAGHRQHLTRVRIDEIKAGGKRATPERAAEPEDAPVAEKARKPRAATPASASAATTEPKKPARPRRVAQTAADTPAKPATRRRRAASQAEPKE